MVRLSRRSRISQQKNRRQSQRRGGRPPKAAPKEPLTLITGRDGSFCADKPEVDCKKIKACDWLAPNSRQPKGYCRSRMDRGTGESSESFKAKEAALQATRDSARIEQYWHEDNEPESSDDEVQSHDELAVAPSSLVVYRASSPKKASPLKQKSASPKAPVKNAREPAACLQKEYSLTSKSGKPFITRRCIETTDLSLNDETNCMVNPLTNRCKSRER